jgi:hypothetical protein
MVCGLFVIVQVRCAACRLAAADVVRGEKEKFVEGWTLPGPHIQALVVVYDGIGDFAFVERSRTCLEAVAGQFGWLHCRSQSLAQDPADLGPGGYSQMYYYRPNSREPSVRVLSSGCRCSGE